MKKIVRNLSTLVTLICLGVLLTNPLQAQSEKIELRVMSYNIHRGGTFHLKQPFVQNS